jgi:hypothetical protein
MKRQEMTDRWQDICGENKESHSGLAETNGPELDMGIGKLKNNQLTQRLTGHGRRRRPRTMAAQSVARMLAVDDRIDADSF